MVVEFLWKMMKWWLNSANVNAKYSHKKNVHENERLAHRTIASLKRVSSPGDSVMSILHLLPREIAVNISNRHHARVMYLNDA